MGPTPLTPLTEEPFSDRLERARADSRRLKIVLGVVPLVVMAMITGVGSVALVVASWWSSTPMPMAVIACLGLTCIALLGCLAIARDHLSLAPQLGALLWVSANVFMIGVGEPAVAVPMTLLALCVGAVIGTLTAPGGSWRWGPITAVAWLVAVCQVDLGQAERLNLAIFPELLLVGMTVLLSRVTAQLAANEAASIASLEDLIGANRRLTERRQEADRANAAKSEFMASMSHELRTPLNAIIGYSELILDAPEELDVEDVDRIATSGRHLLSLVNDVLDMSKIEAGSVELRDEPFHLLGMFAELRDVALELARVHENSVDWSVPASVPQGVIGDAVRLRQIVLNLLGNALKFTHRGKVSLDVSFGDGQLFIAVSDTGPGIRDDMLEQLFVPFSQGKSAGMRHGGTGLGLSISRRLARAMGGDIGVESTLGVGSRFTVAVPLVVAVSPDRQAQADAALG